MNTDGGLPGGTHGDRPRNAWSGPPGSGGFDQLDLLREDQWMHHAVADVVLAHSLLRAMPSVDAERIGLTGVSWGAVLACIAAAIDGRFRFAVPVYGCGFFERHVHWRERADEMGDERAERWLAWWDPKHYLPEVRMPILWVSGTNDLAFPLDALQASYRLPRGPRTLCIRLRMPHGHTQGWAPAEIGAYADSHLAGGSPPAKVTGQGEEGGRAWAVFEAESPVTRAALNYTTDTGPWRERTWESVPATVEGGRARVSLPEGTAVHYLNLTDGRGLTVSTEHVVRRT
jgi:hypothetical protein